MRGILLAAMFGTLGCTSVNPAPRSLASPEGKEAAGEPVVAIFGDVHEDLIRLDVLLQQIRAAGVTHVIGMGDFVEWGGEAKLELALAKITPATGVPPARLWFCPGNWEQTLSDPLRMNRDFARFGNLIVSNYDGAANFDIAGHRVRAGHFPQHALPEELLPPPKFRYRVDGQVGLLDTVARGSKPDRGIELEIVAHTHVAGIYFDGPSQAWTVNAGTINSARKRPTEPADWILWYPARKRLRFVELDSGRPMREIDLEDPKEPCRSSVCTFWNI